jgi:hypothetical protein
MAGTATAYLTFKGEAQRQVITKGRFLVPTSIGERLLPSHPADGSGHEAAFTLRNEQRENIQKSSSHCSPSGHEYSIYFRNFGLLKVCQ